MFHKTELKYYIFDRSEVLPPLFLKFRSLWYLTMCRWVNSFSRFEVRYCLCLQGQLIVLDFLNLKKKTIGNIETSRTTRPTTQRHIPEYVTLLPYPCTNTKPNLICCGNSMIRDRCWKWQTSNNSQDRTK